MKKQNLFLSLATGVLVGAFAFNATAARMGDDDKIRLALNDWSSQIIVTQIAGEVLKKAGYDVELVTAGYEPQFEAIQEGTLTATLEIWSDNFPQEFYDRVTRGELEDFGSIGFQGQVGWWYPAYMESNCPGLPDWQALKNCQDQFATIESGGKGRFVDYPPSWASFNEQRIAALGYDFNLVSAGSEGALVAEMRAAYEKQSPLLIMFWSPHWIFSDLDMKLVELPPALEGCDSSPAVSVNANATHDCQPAPSRINKIGWPGTKDKWPLAYEILKSFEISLEDDIRMMYEVDANKTPIEQVVAAWMEQNESTWQKWIDDAKRK